MPGETMKQLTLAVLATVGPFRDDGHGHGRGDAEYMSLMKGMDSKRKIVSDSLYEEIK